MPRQHFRPYRRTWGTFDTSLSAVKNAETAKIVADAARDRIRASVTLVTNASATVAIDAAIPSLKSDLAIVRTGVQATYDALSSDTDKTAMRTVTVDLDSILATLLSDEQALVSVKSSNDASIRSAEASLASAKAQLEQRRAVPRDVDLAPLRAQVSQLRASLEAARANLDQAILLAPTAGTITHVDIQKGEIASISQAAIRLLPDAPFTIESNVPEADIAKIVVGDPLAITLDAISDVEFHGVILQVDPTQEDIGGVVTYRITATIKDSNEQVRKGMTANLDIETERRENVLFVPQRSVIEEDGKRYVRILRGDILERVAVEVGIRSTEGFLEIRSGLSDGQEIVSFVREK